MRMRIYEIIRRVPTWEELPDYFESNDTNANVYKTDSVSGFVNVVFERECCDLILKTNDGYIAYCGHSYDDAWIVNCKSLAGAYYWLYDSGDFTDELMKLEDKDADKFALCTDCWSVYLRDEGCSCMEDE